MRGWIYIITNESMPGLLKIGFTMKDPLARAKELEGTGIPTKFIVDYEAFLDEPYQVEKKVHAELREFNVGKEWFNCGFNDAIFAIQKHAEKIEFENSRTEDNGSFRSKVQNTDLVNKAIENCIRNRFNSTSLNINEPKPIRLVLIDDEYLLKFPVSFYACYFDDKSYSVFKKEIFSKGLTSFKINKQKNGLHGKYHYLCGIEDKYSTYFKPKKP